MKKTRSKKKVHLLEKAIELAVQAHHGQREKAGTPYILHPLRMMLQMKTDLERIVAVLHDTVEDSPCTLANLERAGFPKEVLDAVGCLTKHKKEPYERFIQRAKSNTIARCVKIADVEDNMDVRRLRTKLTKKDLRRLQKYRRAWAALRLHEEELKGGSHA